MKKLVKSSIKCNHCGDILVSRHRHDFVMCKCGKCFLDGGLDCQRMGFPESPEKDITDLSEYRECLEEKK